MHPHISLFPSTTFYDGKLKDDSTMLSTRNIEWHDSVPPLFFYNLRGREERTSAQSVFNNDEVSAAVNIVKILSQKYPEVALGHRIGIITFYKVQVTKLKRAFVREFGQEILAMIDINTVDGFQGQEKDFIILSCVRSSNNGSVGFLSDRRRTNVGLTRAKYSLVILGDAVTLSNDKIWKELVQSATEMKLIKSVSIRDFRVGNGKCNNLFIAGAKSNSYDRSAE